MNRHTVLWSINGVFVISVRASHSGLEIGERQRRARESWVVLVNTPTNAMLCGLRKWCPAVCALSAKDMLSVRFGVEVQMADEEGQSEVQFRRPCYIVHSAQAQVLDSMTQVFRLLELFQNLFGKRTVTVYNCFF